MGKSVLPATSGSDLSSGDIYLAAGRFRAISVLKFCQNEPARITYVRPATRHPLCGTAHTRTTLCTQVKRGGRQFGDTDVRYSRNRSRPIAPDAVEGADSRTRASG